MASDIVKRALGNLCATVALAGGLVRAQSLDLPSKLPAVVAVAAKEDTAGQAEPELPAAALIANDEWIQPGGKSQPERLFRERDGSGGNAFIASPAAEIMLVQAIEPIANDFTGGGPAELIDAPPPRASAEVMDMPRIDSGEEIMHGITPDYFPMVGAESFNGEPAGGPPCDELGEIGQSDPCQKYDECWTCQVLPSGIIYHSYLAGPKEPRFAAVFFHDKDLNWQLDYSVGGRVGLVRYGTTDNILPQGWQLDLEGAAFPRVNLDENMDLDAADYRIGLPLTYGKDRWQAKLAIYHLSAHVGDEFLIRNPGFQRRNYVRDAFVAGVSYYPMNMLRVYGEAEVAFNLAGGAEPLAFQFGCEVSPRRYNGCDGDPFLALNTSLRQDVDFCGSLSLQLGWQWRGFENQRLLRTGLHFLTGKSNQFEFMRQNETQIGLGAWYDF